MFRIVAILIAAVACTIYLSSVLLTEPFIQTEEKSVDAGFHFVQEFRTAKDTLDVHLHYKNTEAHLAKPYFQNLSTGLVYREDEKFEKYYEEYTRHDNPAVADIGHLCLTMLYSRTQREEFASTEIAKIKNQNLPYLNSEKGFLAYRYNEQQEAERLFTEELKRDPKLRFAIVGLARVYNYTKNYEQLSRLYTSETKEWLTPYLNEIYLYRLDFFSYLQLQFDSFPFVWINMMAAMLIALVWILYMKKVDLFDSVSLAPVIATFAVSVFVTFFCSIPYDAFEVFLHFRPDSAFEEFLYCFFAIGLIEELIKLIPVWICLSIFRTEIKTPYGYLMIAAASALGFASLENLLYFNRYAGDVIYQRAFLSVSAHIFFTMLIVYGAKVISWPSTKLNYKYGVLFFLASIGSHGLYDAFLMVEGLNALWMFSYVIALIGIYGLYRMLNYALNISPSFDTSLKLSDRSLRMILSIGFTIVLMSEFLINAFLHGYNTAYDYFMMSILSFTVMLLLLISNLAGYDVVKNLRTGILTLIKKFNYYDLVSTRLSIRAKSKQGTLDPLPDVESGERIQFSGKGIYILLKPLTEYYGYKHLIIQPYKEIIKGTSRLFEGNLLGIREMQELHHPDSSTKNLTLLGKAEIKIVGDEAYKPHWSSKLGAFSVFFILVFILVVFVMYMNHRSARQGYQWTSDYLENKVVYKAYKNIEYALDKDDDYMEARFLKAKMCLYSNSFDAALAELNLLKPNNSRMSVAADYIRARCYIALNRNEEAIPLLEKVSATSLIPDSTHFLLAQLYYKKGKAGMALNSLKKFQPGNLSAPKTRLESKCLLSEKKFGEAKEKLLALKSLEYKPDGQYFADLGICLLETGDTTEACLNLQEGVRLGNPDAMTQDGIHCYSRMAVSDTLD